MFSSLFRVAACGAVCCSVLQCVAACCSVLQCVAVSRYMFSCVAPYVAQCMVINCIAPVAQTANPSPGPVRLFVLQCVAACCSVLQCVVVRCSVLHCVTQYVAHCFTVDYIFLQCVAEYQ